MRKNKLIIDYEYDFNLVGIISTAKGYKVAWELNQALTIHLVKQPDLIVGFKNNVEKGFDYYSHQTQLNRLKLFKNRPTDPDAGKYYLIPEFPHYDFIILAAMEEYDKMQSLVQSLKSINSIQLAAIIPLEGLKSKSNFIF
ncbi:IPExxxVDY family protein [Chryseolinea sp. T2]|uniref:IPExxxVDY family protein n=1 Tax=Chryseolinea sp. T2 TaxID=3129255 RepID=UPI003076E639